jgi:DNA repair exonuclease SbcCD ATPase subunit
MNIKPVCIEVNNFLSYYHEKMNLKDGLYFISGSNGAGKTSFFIESTTYCLYNKSMSGKKLSELCNKDNPKNMFVNILLNIDNEYHILVERGESPKRFNVYIETDETIDFKNKNKVKFNDSEYISFNNIVLKKVDNLAENVDTQEWLEEKFLKMNHVDFITYVLKSKARDLSYLEMTKADRDKYLENLFSLNTFRKMIDKVKIKMKDQEELSNISKNNYDSSQINLKHTIDKKESIIQIFEKQKTEKIDSIKEYINTLQNNDNKSNEYNLIIKNCKNEKVSLDIDETLEFYDDKVNKLNKKINDNKEQIIVYETEYDNKINDEKVKQHNVSTKISNIDIIYDEKKKGITESGLSLKSNIENLTKQISSIEYSIENAENEKQKYISVQNDEIVLLEKEIEKQKEIYNNKIRSLKNKISELDVADEISLNNDIVKINESIKKYEIKLSKLESKTESVN